MSRAGPISMPLRACRSVRAYGPLTGSHRPGTTFNNRTGLYESHTGTVRRFKTRTGTALAAMTGYGCTTGAQLIFVNSVTLNLVVYLLIWQRKPAACYLIFCMINFMLFDAMCRFGYNRCISLRILTLIH